MSRCGNENGSCTTEHPTFATVDPEKSCNIQCGEEILASDLRWDASCSTGVGSSHVLYSCILWAYLFTGLGWAVVALTGQCLRVWRAWSLRIFTLVHFCLQSVNPPPPHENGRICVGWRNGGHWFCWQVGRLLVKTFLAEKQIMENCNWLQKIRSRKIAIDNRLRDGCSHPAWHSREIICKKETCQCASSVHLRMPCVGQLSYQVRRLGNICCEVVLPFTRQLRRVISCQIVPKSPK